MSSVFLTAPHYLLSCYKPKKKSLTYGEKKELCLLHQKNPSLTQEEIGNNFGIKKNTVCDILKNKEKWLNVELNGSNMMLPGEIL